MPGPTFQKQTQLNTTQLSRHDSIATFTPKFINTLNKHDSRATDSARDLAEFSGKRWVWLKDNKFAFVKGWVTEENETTFQVRCDNESIDRTVDKQDVDKVNPPKFNLADDMADLTYLNEASVIHNLRQRYEADLIYVCLALFVLM
jgi:myosin heavy chain 9/10/11/14